MMNAKNGLGLATVLICELVFAAASVSRGADAPTTRPIDYYGHIVGIDGKPVAGATARLEQYRQSIGNYAVISQATSDAQGRFHMVAEDSGNSTPFAVITAPGVGPTGGPMQDSTEDAPSEFRFRPGADLRIHFVDANDKPIAGMKVWPTYISDPVGNGYVDIFPNIKDEFTQTTDADGIALFKQMPRGGIFEYDFDNAHFARPTPQAEFTTPASGADPVTVKLDAAGSISGRVTSPSGSPVAGVSVSAWSIEQVGAQQQFRTSAGATTDSDGKFLIKSLRGGPYLLRVQLAAEQSKQYAAPAGQNVTLDAGQDLAGQDIALVVGAIITGKVTTTGTGAPIANVRVSASSSTGAPTSQPTGRGRAYVRTADGDLVLLSGDVGINANISSAGAMTGEDGSYTMHILHGAVMATASAPMGYIVPRNTARNTVQLEENQTLTQDFQFDVDPVPPLKIQVVDAAGNPVPYATILLELASTTGRGGPGISQPRSDADGKYTMRSPAIGTVIRARKGNLGTTDMVILSEANRGDIKLTITKDALASALVHVTDNSGQPIADAQLSIIQRIGTRNTSATSGTTAENGQYTARGLFPDMTYAVSGRAKGYGSGSITLQQMQPGKQLDVKLQLVKADSFVSGMVLDENQLPLADIDVYVSAPRTSGQTVKTDFTGHFRADGIVPGDTVQVYTRAGNRIAQAQPERVPAGTTDLIVIHDPASLPPPATAPGGRGGIGAR